MATSKPTGPLPSVDRLARSGELAPLLDRYGRSAVVAAIRVVLDVHRRQLRDSRQSPPTTGQLAGEVSERLARRSTPALKRMLNLSGTVLHTNLGRALLPESAVRHVNMAMTEACNLEFDTEAGVRGERDTLVEDLLAELSGAEAATVVNNNAAAVLLVLAALAHEREVVVSRGELVEIGGSFRIPDVMRCAGARLVEVGTTNRTHAADYAGAIGEATAALMKVHASNYCVTGFVAQVREGELAGIAHARGLPLVMDLGSGSLVDLSAFGLPKEPVVREAIAAGADVVTFSGDKLLGGPQAGLIVGRRDLLDRIRRHPLKRALRVSKLTLAALEATLLAYRNPDTLASELPTLRLLTRPVEAIAALCRRMQPPLAAALGAEWEVAVVPVASQVGSGSLPVDVIPSMALAARPKGAKSGSVLQDLALKLLQLPVPIVCRVAEGQLLLDLRCLEHEGIFLEQIAALSAEVN